MPPELKTQRLTLQAVAAPQAERIAGLVRLPDVRRHLCDDMILASAQVAAWIAESDDPSSLTEFWTLATDDAPMMGLIGLSAPGDRILPLRAIGWRSLELTVALDPRHWGQGLATEAIGALADYAAGNPVTFALVGCVEAPNLRSPNLRAHNLMQRCGFHELGRLQATPHPVVVYERPL